MVLLFDRLLRTGIVMESYPAMSYAMVRECSPKCKVSSVEVLMELFYGVNIRLFRVGASFLLYNLFCTLILAKTMRIQL